MTRDPLGEEGGVNLYTFVRNDSVNMFDLLGLAYSPIGEHGLDWDTLRIKSLPAASVEKSRQWWYDKTIEVGRLPTGLPRELLRKYIWEDNKPLELSPSEFLKQVKPLASVYEPNLYGKGYKNVLEEDIKKNCCDKTKSNSFTGTYSFGAFHGAHSTGGLGYFTMNATVNVKCKGIDKWYIYGVASMEPELWNFDWKFLALIAEQGSKVFGDMEALHGRETRTFLGSFIPGKQFLIKLKGNLKIFQSNFDKTASFSN